MNSNIEYEYKTHAVFFFDDDEEDSYELNTPSEFIEKLKNNKNFCCFDRGDNGVFFVNLSKTNTIKIKTQKYEKEGRLVSRFENGKWKDC